MTLGLALLLGFLLALLQMITIILHHIYLLSFAKHFSKIGNARNLALSALTRTAS